MGESVKADRNPLPIDAARGLLSKYARVRAFTEELASPLAPEDCLLQSMPEASPTKWHLAHTTWFFETFVLAELCAGFRPFDARYGRLFNSYYQSIGPCHPRPRRGLLSRPTLEEVRAYRHWIDERMGELLSTPLDERSASRLAELVTLGLEHERQHQELLLTDIKHAFSQNPLGPAYRPAPVHSSRKKAPPLDWIHHPGGLSVIGHDGVGFAFDNETPGHRVHLEPFEIATRLVTHGEYLAFIEDGGYRRPELWLSDGWEAVSAQGFASPLYWQWDGSSKNMATFTFAGWQPIDFEAPVCHLSFYEADAYARWMGARLPTESEWEVVAKACPIEGNFIEGKSFQPIAAVDDGPSQFFGDAWEWTSSPFVPYPGFRPLAGSLGEYNGKFMCNQMVLRGGSALCSVEHIRASYRNFFYPHARWQMTGIRLARSS